MRPYNVRKDDKFSQGVQPSPLALLAATCSRIGETLHENSVFTQKNITTNPVYLGKDKADDFTYTKTCIEGSRASVFQPLEHQRTIDELQGSYIDSESHNFYSSNALPSCVKIKHEEPYDYNHNTSEVHICPPNIISDTRAYESQSRQDFSKSCCHEPQASSTFPETRHESILYSTNSTVNEQSSCLFQNSMDKQPISVPPSPISPRNTIPTNNNIPNQKQYPWQNDPAVRTVTPVATVGNEMKPSCMMYSNYDNTSPLQHFNTTSIQQSVINTTRESRNSLSHLPNVNEMSRQYSPPAVVSNSMYSSHGSPFQSYNNYNTMVDEKPDAFALQQAYNSSHVPPQNYGQPMTPALPSTPSPIQMVPHGIPPGMVNSPIEGPPSFATAYHSHMMGPGMHPNSPMPPNMSEFSYNPTYYGRESYRRPRRIACTCPNCRDGENKTITTRDGKQKKQHICHIPGCGKIYGKTSHLRAHLRWHAGERPFACNWLFCNKRFTRSDELQRHRRTHTGDKRFECTICLKKFMRSDHLSKHMKTHQAPNAKHKDKNENKNASEQSKTVASNKATKTDVEKSSTKTNLTESLAL